MSGGYLSEVYLGVGVTRGFLVVGEVCLDIVRLEFVDSGVQMGFRSYFNVFFEEWGVIEWFLNQSSEAFSFILGKDQFDCNGGIECWFNQGVLSGLLRKNGMNQSSGENGDIYRFEIIQEVDFIDKIG